MGYYDRILEAADWIRARDPRVPAVGLVLGSGLGEFADHVGDPKRFSYGEIPHWPPAAVIGHTGTLVLGEVRGCPVAVLSGRSHYYEGHDMHAVTFGTRVLATCGVKTLILTNAAGGVNIAFGKGTIMVIDDHINLMGANPLRGPHDERLGPRFPDMTEVYSRRLRDLADAAASTVDVPVTHGVYAALQGPSYETAAEIRYLRTIGADAIGMSTVPEAIVARHMAVEVLGLSCITNAAAGVLPGPLDHNDVLETAHRVGRQFIRLLEEILARI